MGTRTYQIVQGILMAIALTCMAIAGSTYVFGEKQFFTGHFLPFFGPCCSVVFLAFEKRWATGPRGFRLRVESFCADRETVFKNLQPF